jgi:hypothetical protein
MTAEALALTVPTLDVLFVTVSSSCFKDFISAMAPAFLIVGAGRPAVAAKFSPGVGGVRPSPPSPAGVLAAGTTGAAAKEVGGAEATASDRPGRVAPEGAPRRLEDLGELRAGGGPAGVSAASGMEGNSEAKTDGSSAGAGEAGTETDETGAGGLAAAVAVRAAAEIGRSGNALAPGGMARPAGALATGRRAEADAAETTGAGGEESPAITALRTDGSSEDESSPAASPVQGAARNSGDGAVAGPTGAGAGGVAARETTASAVDAAAELAARRRRPESPAAEPTSLLLGSGWPGAAAGPGGTVVAAAEAGEVAGLDEAAVSAGTAGAGLAAAGDFGPAGRKWSKSPWPSSGVAAVAVVPDEAFPSRPPAGGGAKVIEEPENCIGSGGASA